MAELRTSWPLYAGMLVAGAAAVVASASTLSALAEAAGWEGWTPWLLPAAVDVGGSAGGWCWLRPDAPTPARRFGRLVALAGAGISLVGNAAGHLMATGYLLPGPVLVVIVGAVPAAVLVALAHLAALLTIPTPNSEDDGTPVADDRTQTDEHAQTRDAVLALLQDRPQTIADLARATGRSRTTVIGHLTALTAAGAVHRDERKRYTAAQGSHPTGHTQEATP